MPVNTDELEGLMATIQKNYGKSSISTGNNTPNVERISTGSIQLDYATSGGIPIGRFSRFYGSYSSGKSLSCWNVIKKAQDMGMTCAYYNAEKQFDPAFVARRGVDVAKLIVVEGSIIEEICTKMESLLGAVHLHVIDSLSTCVSLHELAADLQDQQMAMSARAWGKGLRRVSEQFDATENTVILVDQIREAFGAYGGQVKVPGGKMVEHTSSMSLLFKRGSWLFRDDKGLLDDDKIKQTTFAGLAEPDGCETQVRCEKSRVGPPLRPARVRIDFATMEYDLPWELAVAASFFGYATRAGAWYALPDGRRVQGERKLRQLIAEDPEVQAEITTIVRGHW